MTVKRIQHLLSSTDPPEVSRTNTKFATECNIDPEPQLWHRTIKRHTNVPRIRSFFIRLTNAIAWSNKQYHRFRRIESPHCLWCNEAVQERKHLFFTCPETERLFALSVDRNIPPQQLIGDWLRGEIKEGKGFLIGFCTYFTYRQNLAKKLPSREAFLVWLDAIRTIEEEIATRKEKLDKHLDKWTQIELALL